MNRNDERGEMLLLMSWLTLFLVGLAGALLWVLGRPVPPAGPVALQQALITGAVEMGDAVLDEAVVDPEMVCTAVAEAGRAQGITVSDCQLNGDLLTVTAVGRSGQSLGGQAQLHTDASGCVQVRTSWGEVLASRCPSNGKDS